MEDLTKACYAFMDRNAIDVLADESFTCLTKDSLKDLLCRDTFLAPEFQIFTIVSGWCTHNSDVDAGSILSNVRLPLMNVDELLHIRKTGVISAEKLMDALEVRNTIKTLPYRVWPNVNMAELKYHSKVIKGKWLKDSVSCDIPTYDLAGSASGSIIPDPEIIIELGIISIINSIEFIITNGNEKSSYFVEVSENQSQWTKIADYTLYDCGEKQNIYFPPRYVKYIKLTGTSKEILAITFLMASYKEKIGKFINGFRIASVVLQGRQKGKFVPVFTSKKSPDRFELKKSLKQPHYIETMRLLISKNTESSDYVIELSPNDSVWFPAEVTSSENGSWMEVSGKPFPVVYFRVSCNYEANICRPQVSEM